MKTDTDWGYVGDEGPMHWADLSDEFCACGGQHQSPIDLPSKGIPATNADVTVNYTCAEGMLSYTSYGVQMSLDGGQLVMDGVPYRFAQFHFHTPSEHRIDTHPFPGEVHLVHVAENGHIVVLAVFLENGPPNPLLAPIWSTFPAVEDSPTLPFNPAHLLPDDRTAYKYEGSLTTPPCTEDVTWLVMKEPLLLSDVQIENLTAVHASENIHNSRPLQPINDRTVELVTLSG